MSDPGPVPPPVPRPPAPPPPEPGAGCAPSGQGCLVGAGVVALAFSLLLVALSANPCGAFGDACDDRGEVTGGLVFALGLLAAAVGAIVVGVALLWRRRR